MSAGTLASNQTNPLKPFPSSAHRLVLAPQVASFEDFMADKVEGTVQVDRFNVTFTFPWR